MALTTVVALTSVRDDEMPSKVEYIRLLFMDFNLAFNIMVSPKLLTKLRGLGLCASFATGSSSSP